MQLFIPDELKGWFEHAEDIDHVHIEVTDRDAVAEWYLKLLGLQRNERLAAWAEDPVGPLILSTADTIQWVPNYNGSRFPDNEDATQ